MERQSPSPASRLQRHHKRCTQARRRMVILLALLACALCGLVVTLIIVHVVRPAAPQPSPPAARATDKTDEKYSFVDSHYQGIRSKLVSRTSTKEKVSLEYPLTGNNTIDTTIASAIDQLDHEFRQSVAAGRTFHRPMTEAISYQITHNTNAALSVVVQANQDTHGAHPASFTRFWTFNKQTGTAITLRDLVGGNTVHLRTVIDAAQRSVAATIAERQQPAVDPGEMVTEDALTNFVITNDNTLAWPFSQAALVPSSYGTMTISLPFTSILAALQTTQARQIATIPALPKPQPKPIATPAPASPAPSASCAQACIALTFDDGPGPYTNELLDTLDQYGAKGTFFMIGSKVAARADVARRIHTSGHQLGNHSWSHPVLPQYSAEAIGSELDRTNSAITQATGTTPTIMRPPYGAVNSVVLEQLRQRGMASILWSVDTRDWADRNSTIVCNRAVAGARPGAIILMHDIHPTSVNAVPCILSTLKQQGYRFVTVQALLGKTTPGVNYP